MDLAQNLATWRDRSPEQWAAHANRLLPPIAVAVLVLLIAFNLADLTWRLLESPTVDEVAPPVLAMANGATDTRRYDALSSWAPFGTAPDESSAAIPAGRLLDAPDTALNLTLIGIVQASELPERGSMVIPERGAAIISGNRGEQQLYWSGDRIDDSGDATLHSVFSDRVLLQRAGGRLETLRYSETATAPQPSSRLAVRPQARQTPLQAPGTSASLAEAVGEAAALLGEHMQFAMHTENGQMVGFRVQPRGDGRVFAQLGLEANDVLTEVNGMLLNDLRNTTQVLQALSEAQQANVRIRRNGFDQALILNIDQIERLAESLQ